MGDLDPRSPEVGYSHRVSRDDVAQIVGVVGGPLALLMGLQAKYTLVEMWACKSAAGPIVVHLVALLTLLLALGAALLAHRQWRGAGREPPGDPGGREGRRRTLAAVGLGSSLLSALVIFAQWLPQFFISPCSW
jgi:hypothetical protein